MAEGLSLLVSAVVGKETVPIIDLRQTHNFNAEVMDILAKLAGSYTAANNGKKITLIISQKMLGAFYHKAYYEAFLLTVAYTG